MQGAAGFVPIPLSIGGPETGGAGSPLSLTLTDRPACVSTLANACIRTRGDAIRVREVAIIFVSLIGGISGPRLVEVD